MDIDWLFCLMISFELNVIVITKWCKVIAFSFWLLDHLLITFLRFAIIRLAFCCSLDMYTISKWCKVITFSFRLLDHLLITFLRFAIIRLAFCCSLDMYTISKWCKVIAFSFRLLDHLLITFLRLAIICLALCCSLDMYTISKWRNIITFNLMRSYILFLNPGTIFCYFISILNFLLFIFPDYPFLCNFVNIWLSLFIVILFNSASHCYIVLDIFECFLSVFLHSSSGGYIVHNYNSFFIVFLYFSFRCDFINIMQVVFFCMGPSLKAILCLIFKVSFDLIFRYDS